MAREIYGPLYSVRETAKYLGIGINRTYELIKKNRLPHIKDKNGNLVAKSVLDDYIEEQYKNSRCANNDLKNTTSSL